jgi:hypothetical protein
MTFSAEFKEDLLWQVAHFMVESKGGDLLKMPAGFLVKKMDGRLALSRGGESFWTLFAPTSDSIVATVERWAFEPADTI